MRRWEIALLTLAMCVGQDLNAQESASRAMQREDKKQREGKTFLENLEKKLTSTGVARAPAACPAECTDAKREKDWWHELATDPVATFTALLFLATAALWWATMRLVQGAADTSKRQLRAYVQIGGDKGPVLDAQGTGPEIHLFMKNAGQTPAYDVTHWFSVGILDFPLKEPLPEPDRSTPRMKNVLQPGASISFINKLGQPLDAKTITQIRDGSKYRVYAWGETTYRDAFDEWHYTRFRLMHGGRESDAGTMQYCDAGNEAN